MISNYFIRIKKKIDIYKISILIVFSFFIVVTGTYSVYTPAFMGHDEPSHYENIVDVLSGTKPIDYVSKQPLYYIINASILGLITHFTLDNNIQIHLLRIFSILCGLTTIFFVFQISKEVFYENKWLPIMTTGFVSFLPTFDWITSMVNSDVLVWTLSTISVYFLIKFSNDVKKTKFIILSAIFASLAISTKVHALVLIPVFLIMLIYFLISKQISIKFFSKILLIFVGVTIVVSIWEMLFRLIIHVDPIDFGFLGNLRDMVFNHTIDKPYPELNFNFSEFPQGFSRMTDVDFLYTRLFKFSFGGLTYPFIWAPRFYYYLALAISSISLLGLILFILKKINVSNLHFRKPHLLILFTVIILLVGTVYFFYLFSEVGIARYTYPAISAYGVFFTLGLYILIPKKKFQFLLIIPMVFLVILNFNLLLSLNGEYQTDLGFVPQNLTLFYKHDETSINDPLLDNVSWKNMTIVPGFGYVDLIDSKLTNDNPEIFIHNTKIITHIAGWGLFSQENTTVKYAYVFVDNVVQSKAYYGLLRPDIPKTYGLHVSSYSGWYADLDLRKLSLGCHNLSVRLASDLKYSEIKTGTRICVY